MEIYNKKLGCNVLMNGEDKLGLGAEKEFWIECVINTENIVAIREAYKEDDVVPEQSVVYFDGDYFITDVPYKQMKQIFYGKE